MSKEFLNTLTIEEIKERLHNGEKICNVNDVTSYAKYIDGIGICKFRRNDELLAVNFTLTLFNKLYFDNSKEDYESMIGCVGWFWDNENDTKRLGFFECKDKEYFCDENKSRWVHFAPAKNSELKFWEGD